ncbi:hypothetical protein PsalMR5_04305 (plasmid) [Piscirickettsia salmonis]|uniref:DUF2442 domain-containing protein n=1 Tax=Piscirickettsia salmonis TaxID=1238 RepID=UPI0012BAD760|nr:DUF2442 domain-containing protein [Piscirickettsia salmonis]QGP56808.1 hypothetical protein PsalSR1_04297 [Piscirickettsia salmonis]QGP61524.1 hypothetical protein PsalBI1_04166 [Piscirickettsia salmonis]QGP66380.1 hypothetical protein PsalMR5_04305 [Piscirickettsia salmonis]
MRRESSAKENSSPEIVCTAPWRVVKVKALGEYAIEVEFVDGTVGQVQMKKLIFSSIAGVFSQLRDSDVFNQVFVLYGVATWPGEIDLAPDAMYTEIKNNGVWVID